MPAVWIDLALRDQAQAYGYTVVDASTVTATHLNHLILTHAAELLGRQETQALLDHLAKDMPKVVDELVPKILPLGVVQKVLQNLLEEGIHIRDMRTIVETLAEVSVRSQDSELLTTLRASGAWPIYCSAAVSKRFRNAGDVTRSATGARAASSDRWRRRECQHRTRAGRYAHS